MALAQLKNLVENFQELTKDLLAQNEKAEKILKEYKEKFNDVTDIENGLAEIKDDLVKLQIQATDKPQVIVFVGAVNSGKSSLINALLRGDPLPTSTGESTVCSFKISTTVEEEWSLQLDGKEKKYGDDFKKIMKACSKLGGSHGKATRKKLKITEKSVLQVNWPEKLCKSLPPNFVLYDTPGFGEDKEVFKALKESCKTADTIVAVMDTTVPSLEKVSKGKTA